MQKSPRFFFHLFAVEGVIPLLALFSIPSEGGSVSPARLALIASVVFLIAVWTILGFRPPHSLTRWVKPGFIAVTALLSLTFGLLLFLLRYLDPDAFLPLFQRLSPLLWYLLALSVQSTFLLLTLKNGFHPAIFKDRKKTIQTALAAFSILLFILFLVSFTKLGITKDDAYWGEPGVSILGWQFGLAILIGAIILAYQSLITNYPISPNSRLLDLLLPLSVWLTASVLWLSVPISSLRNSFYAPITPPYTTPFPYSDAGFYDYLSQSLLIGTDFFGGIPPRPLYVTFLAVLHFLFGQDYVIIIAAQTLVLALFPVVLYLLAAKIHSRAAGVTVALLAIFRELTTLWISSNTRTASTKMFVSDFSTALGIAFTCLVAVWWLERRDTKSTMIAGGVFGILLLLRTQSLIILPVLFLLAFFVYQKQMKGWLGGGITFGLVMAVTITPWLIHNYAITGQLAFDDPAQMAVIYSQYSFDENLDISKFDFGSESLGSRLISFTLANPSVVGGFIANHFLNTQIGGLLTLPLIESFDGLLAPVNLYWVTWDGTLTWYNLALVIFYIFVIAVGFGAAWNRLKWIGLVPLAFNLGYALANGISRFSSWRYNLPVDWVAYFYFGIGAIEVLSWIVSLFGARSPELDQGRKTEMQGNTIPAPSGLILLGFVFLGSLPWMATGLAQPRYTSTNGALVEQAAKQGLARNDVENFLSQSESQLFEGMLLYPRFFRRDDGIFSAHPWPIYQARDFSRLGFMVLNDQAFSVVFPADQPLAFAHGSDVLVLGCVREDYVEARWIYFPESDAVFQNGPLTEPCSP